MPWDKGDEILKELFRELAEGGQPARGNVIGVVKRSMRRRIEDTDVDEVIAEICDATRYFFKGYYEQPWPGYTCPVQLGAVFRNRALDFLDSKPEFEWSPKEKEMNWTIRHLSSNLAESHRRLSIIGGQFAEEFIDLIPDAYSGSKMSHPKVDNMALQRFKKYGLSEEPLPNPVEIFGKLFGKDFVF